MAAVLATLAVLRLTGSGGDGGPAAPVQIDRSPAAAAGGERRPEGADAPGIYVHVAGAVHHPGLVRVPDGARVAFAVERAGGPGRRADLSGVNLAARLEDGQQVVVPLRGAAAAAAGAATPPGTAGAPKPSLGTATPDQLDEVDGIGPTLAGRIVEYRTEHGGFRSLQELREVEGIGEKRFETLREALGP
ncbi:MAG: competence protein ComEA [Thermoleophilaceae bacterium]|nr:competence protein ComEA [Thermoleophilaceae bacterium]